MERLSLVAALVVLASGTATAEVSYNYFELGYLETEIDVDTGFGNLEVDGDGFVGGVSFSLVENFFFLGELSDTDLDGADLSWIKAGFGWHSDLSQSAQAVVQATWQRLELDTGFGDTSENGYGLSAGGRGEFGDNVEWDLFFDYVDFDDAEAGFSGELRYKFTPQLAIGANFQSIDDIDQYGIHFRWLYAN